MEKQAGKVSKNWVIRVESRNEQHQEIILATIAKRAYQRFEQRGCAHGFDMEDWIAAEKEFLQNDFNGNPSQFDQFALPAADNRTGRSHLQPLSRSTKCRKSASASTSFLYLPSSKFFCTMARIR
jgi:hypothetical protein